MDPAIPIPATLSRNELRDIVRPFCGWQRHAADKRIFRTPHPRPEPCCRHNLNSTPRVRSAAAVGARATCIPTPERAK